MTQIVTYRDTQTQGFSQLRFDSGERVLVSIATFPQPEVKVLRLAFGGLIPRETIWAYNSATAGGSGAYLRNMMTMFIDIPLDEMADENLKSPLQSIVEALIQCHSIADAKAELARREHKLAVNQS